MITYHVEPTAAEKALTARVMALSLGQLKDICRKLYAPDGGVYHGTEEDIVFDACMGRLAGIMGDAEFTAFCRELEGE
jgi:hypothetical protein